MSSPSGDNGEPPAKRQRVEAPPAATAATTSAASATQALVPERSQSQQAVASHYNKIKQVSVQQRRQSPIIRLKCLNNWVKSVTIDKFLLTFANASVLDICGGKGGDLNKFLSAEKRVARWVLADHAAQSVRDAQRRFQSPAKNPDHERQKQQRQFAARFVVADCMRVRLAAAFPDLMKFDLVSCQFALHYSFESEARAHVFMRNVSERLNVGGHFVATFPDANVLVQKLRAANANNADALAGAKPAAFGNSIYNVQFDALPTSFDAAQPFGVRYSFSLTDAIDDCAE
jgi:mRNA (guanine-N7-)-methyltransferase